jgi:hypothetical protein
MHAYIHTLYILWIHRCVIKTSGCGTSHKIHKVHRILQWSNTINALYNSITIFTHKKDLEGIKAHKVLAVKPDGHRYMEHQDKGIITSNFSELLWGDVI